MMSKYIAILLLVFSGSVQALSGNEYRTLSKHDRLIWVGGAIQGILTAQLFTTKEQPHCQLVWLMPILSYRR